MTPLDYSSVGKRTYLTLQEGDNINAIHTSGDNLIGALGIRAPDPIIVTDLTVSLVCEVTSKINLSPCVTTTEIRILNEIRKIIDRPTVLGGCRSCATPVYISRFQLPRCTSSHHSQLGFEPSDEFVVGSVLQLPPTFECRTTMYSVQSVSYFIELVMTEFVRGGARPPREPIRITTDRLQFRFVPSRLQRRPDPRLIGESRHFTTKSGASPPYSMNIVKTLLEIVSLFKSKEQSTVAVMIRTTSSQQLCVGNSIPITLCLDQDIPNLATSLLPEIFLRRIYARLKGTMDFRAKNVPLPHPSVGQIEALASKSTRTVIVKRSLPRIQLLDRTSLNDIVPELRVPIDAVLSF
ncbi:MAG: hypothetical protein MMC23_007925 [Stictis urceolatum]|nr:hypothetical protein [Stictis urceolata]